MCSPEGKEETKEESNIKNLSIFMFNMLANWMRFHLMKGGAKKENEEREKDEGEGKGERRRKRRKERRKEGRKEKL